MSTRKYTFALLAASFFICLLSGCSRTVIEHQFYTESITDTEYVTELVQSSVMEEYQKLKALFKSHDLELYMQILYDFPANDVLESSINSYENWKNPEPTDELLKIMLNTEQNTRTLYIKECSNSIGDYITEWRNAAEQIYTALNMYANEDTWNALKQELEEKEDYDCFALVTLPIRVYDEQGTIVKTYAMTHWDLE